MINQRRRFEKWFVPQFLQCSESFNQITQSHGRPQKCFQHGAKSTVCWQCNANGRT